jgi:predicted dehydrogenase
MAQLNPLMNSPEESVSIMVIGVGLHATKAYLPTLAKDRLVRTAVVIEVAEKVSSTKALLERFAGPQFAPEVVSAGPAGSLPSRAVVRQIFDAIQRHGIKGVIIATPPEQHSFYLHLALDHGLHVLVDKPILSAEDLTVDPTVAARVAEDFAVLDAKVAAKPSLIVSVAAQRRWHVGFAVVRELVMEAADRFGIPITSIQSMHQDGQLRLPHEIGTIRYHGYDLGVGKLSHSAYHEIDLQTELIRLAAREAGVVYDSFTTYAQTIRPAGFLRSHPRRTWEARFGAEAWAGACPDDDATLAARYKGFGEIDLMANTAFTIDGVPALLSSLNLLHDSVSGRGWLRANTDLYKGNGRQKGEQHVIDQGDVQTILVHSFQAKHRHDFNSAEDFTKGGNSHFDITLLRNTALWPGARPMETITALDIATKNDLAADRLLMSHAKDAMLRNFLDNLTGVRPVEDNPSLLTSHRLAMTLYGAIASSAATAAPIPRAL